VRLLIRAGYLLSASLNSGRVIRSAAAMFAIFSNSGVGFAAEGTLVEAGDWLTRSDHVHSASNSDGYRCRIVVELIRRVQLGGSCTREEAIEVHWYIRYIQVQDKVYKSRYGLAAKRRPARLC